MNPLDRILKWWESLSECPSDWIAVKVCFFFTVRREPDSDFRALFCEFLTEELTLPLHLGRALAVRAAIDYYFAQERLNDAERSQMDLVETSEDPKLKALANAAIGRRLQSAADRARARDTWSALREAELSDSGLESWGRIAMFRSILP